MASNPEGIGSTITHAVQHTGQRLKHLIRPDGRRVHIAASPEEHARLHKSLGAIEPDDNFDVCIHGSPEHLATIREIHAHHEERRDQLREKHADVYEEFEKVHLQLETLSHELQHLTEHGVSLDANFSKFGYDAHLSRLGTYHARRPLSVKTVQLLSSLKDFYSSIDFHLSGYSIICS